MKALAEYQKLAGLTQWQLANRIGVDQGQLSNWMSKKRTPTIQNLKLIAERTGISLERLARDL